MNTFKKAIINIFKDAGKAFKTFPSAIGCAVCFALVTIIRIQLEWPQQEPYNFLFNCLHWAFALGAILSLPLITYVQSRISTQKAFNLANLLGIAAAAVTFVLLYRFGASDPEATGSQFAVISNIAAARVSALLFISLLAFNIFAGYPKDKSDFAKAFFMAHKAFFIALLYGGVVLAGASGVAGAIEALLYNDMSSKVYLYISTLSGLLAFTIFVGYFPDFQKDSEDAHRETAQKHPRFIEILFGYILVPIVLALTVVLLIWAGKTIISGVDTYFNTLYGIAASYTIGGIWLHIMVTHYETGLAKFYKKIYPLAALVILVFEAWALFLQLGATGLKFTEYAFGVVWIFAAVSSILLLVKRERSHSLIVMSASLLALVYVMPILGYNALPVNAQSNRLEALLVKEEMFVDGKIVPAVVEPALVVRQNITDAVDYLAYANDATLPSWFDKDIVLPNNFETAMGFEQTWPTTEGNHNGNTQYLATMLYLRAEPIDISGYQWALNPQEEYQKGQSHVTLIGAKASYDIYWDVSSPSGIPVLRVTMGDAVVLEKDMKELVDAAVEKYPLGQAGPIQAGKEDLSITAVSEEISVLVVLRSLDINFDPQNDIINYWINLDAIYVLEN
ncbi:MAG: DUF4153 domain-containing protein [Clostridia bacterium]|nr:DUF4153 domain-containing protein [Clostridia bacterium]